MIEHKPLSLADQIFERLETDILTEKYHRGEVLSELKLVQDLQVSRTPIREAIVRLKQEHLVDITSHGIVVVGVTPQDIKDIYTIRLRLEGIVAGMAASVITDEQLAQLHDILDMQEYFVQKQSPDNIRDMDSQFHNLIYQISSRPVLSDLLTMLHTKSQRMRRLAVMDNERALCSIAEHRAVYEALKARDSEKATKCMEAHILAAMENINKQF